MLSKGLIVLYTCLSNVLSRDIGKTFKTLPYVTNSLVNLGKMDISFHFNAHPLDSALKLDRIHSGSSAFYSPKIASPIEEPCPCSSLTNLKDSTQAHPSELLNRLLSGNDLFSFKEPTSSPLCCDSHENVQEDILFEFGPKQTQIFANPQISHSFPFLPYLFDSLKKRPALPTASVKPKTVEIFVFPKKQGILSRNIEKFQTKKKDAYKNDAIKIVGEQEMRNDFKTVNLVPPIPVSVKKDLALQEKKSHLQENKHVTKKVEGTPGDKLFNTVV